MQDSFQGTATKPLFVNRQYAVTSYSDADALTKNFKPICGGDISNILTMDNCLHGIPAVWFAQTAFGKYHGGQNGNVLLPAMEYGMIPGIKVPPEMATFALDMRKNFNDEALEKVTESLKNVLKHLGNQADLSYLVYNPRVHKDISAANAKCGHPAVPQCGFSLQDAINNKNAYDYLASSLSDASSIDPSVARAVQIFSSRMSQALGRIIQAYGNVMKPAEVIPKELVQTTPGVLAVLTMALDFYAKEPYRQSFKAESKKGS